MRSPLKNPGSGEGAGRRPETLQKRPSPYFRGRERSVGVGNLEFPYRGSRSAERGQS